jgi:glycosyltransferase involved in cell wall biosynthesis
MPGALVSVVLPVYNGDKFVVDAIRSIQKQTFYDWELIILDDGSRDSSLEICKGFGENDQRISVYANGINLGLAKTMNKLVRLTRGKYIAVQEQDDISMPDRLSQEVRLLELNPNVGLVSGVAAWLDDAGRIFAHFPGRLHRGEPYPENKQELVTYLFIEQCKVVNAACMFRKMVLDEIPGPFDEEARMSIDWQFFLHVAHRFQIVGIPVVLVRMKRGQQHNHLTNKKDLEFYEARRCINLIFEKYKDDKISPINYQLYRKAMATELILEGRFWGRLRGLSKLIQAIFYDPLNDKIWRSIGESLARAINKTLRIVR